MIMGDEAFQTKENEPTHISLRCLGQAVCCMMDCNSGPNFPRSPADVTSVDLKVEVKRRVSAHRRSVTATGGGTGVEELSPFDKRGASLVGDTALSGVVGAHEGDTDHPQGKYAELINVVIILVIQLAAHNTHSSCVKMPGY